jgi:hypothetical protein
MNPTTATIPSANGTGARYVAAKPPKITATQ